MKNIHATVNLQCDTATLGQLRFNHANSQSCKAIIADLLNNQQRNNTLISFVNPHVYNLSCEHPDVSRVLSQSQLCCIDGVGIQIAATIINRAIARRVVAEELFNALLINQDFSCNAVLIGVESSELALATTAINEQSNAINIIDSCDGFRSDAEYSRFLSDHTQTDLILIGAGTPRSEQIALLAFDLCQRAVIWHIGAGTIKTWAGTKRRAPAWMSRCGLQWLHRIYFEPHTRTRYLSGAQVFIKNIMQTRELTSKGNVS